MNQGRPPYGNQPTWGQTPSAGQAPYQPMNPQMNPQMNQPMMNQPMSQQMNPQMNQQMPQGYQQRPPVGQGSVYQQPVYPQQNPYGQQAYPQQNPYGQPAYPQQNYPQQAPYGQMGYSAGVNPQSMYGQPPASPAPVAPGPSNGSYIGYQPPRPKKPIQPENLVLLVLAGLLPVLFIVAMVLSGVPALKWVFAVVTVATIAYLWITRQLNQSLRTTLSLIGGILALVAVVTALAAPPQDNTNQNQGNQQGQQVSTQGQNVSNVQNHGGFPQSMPATTDMPTATPPMDNATAECLMTFFHYWSQNDYDQLVKLTLPSWQKQQTEPKTQLFAILANRYPLEYSMEDMSGTSNDISRTAVVKATIDKRNGLNPEVYLFSVVLTKENGAWYVDPRSLKSNETVTPTPATENTMPTQPPQFVPTASTVLYFNPDGGSFYHLDQNCISAHASNLPFRGSFTWSQVNDAPYNELKACASCGAPLREQ
ncbi:MAG: hypothetical protein E7333_08050 [Clostridiales bacterium]|nr:hypothetical protein [Clostridiales bacterium]